MQANVSACRTARWKKETFPGFVPGPRSRLQCFYLISKELLSPKGVHHHTFNTQIGSYDVDGRQTFQIHDYPCETHYVLCSGGRYIRTFVQMSTILDVCRYKRSGNCCFILSDRLLSIPPTSLGMTMICGRLSTPKWGHQTTIASPKTSWTSSRCCWLHSSYTNSCLCLTFHHPLTMMR